MDRQDLLNRLAEDEIEHLWVAYHDYNGRACAKTIPKHKFENVIEKGLVFARANLNFTLNDDMAADGIWQAHTGDFLAVPDPAAYWKLPYQANTAIVFSRMMTEAGEAFAGCPRQTLENLLTKYAEKNISITTALEAEFSLFQKAGDGEYAPSSFDGMFTVAGLNRYAELMHEIVSTLEAMGIQVEQLGKEYGPSQYELTVRYGRPIQAADNYLITKEVTRALAFRHGMIATYMPKPYSDLPGNGLHIHLALWDRESQENLLAGSGLDCPLSGTGRHFVGGLMAHAAGLSAVGAPTVNSYKRLQPGSWAPAHIAWGVGNRGILLRVPDVHERCRVEYRAGDNTCNPYLFLSALLAAGLDGIQKQLHPGKPFNELDVGHFSELEREQHQIQYLPRTLPAALDALERDEILMSALAPPIAGEFLKVKRLELEAYNLHVHPWERQMYLEVT